MLNTRTDNTRQFVIMLMIWFLLCFVVSCRAQQDFAQCNYEGVPEKGQCQCLEELYSGARCEWPKRHCASSPCLNGGICM